MVKTWTARRLIESLGWDDELLESLRGMPTRPDSNMAGTDAPIRTHVRATDPFLEMAQTRRSPAAEVFRSVYMKKQDFDEYGYTGGCEGCERLRAELVGYRNHTADCRR